MGTTGTTQKQTRARDGGLKGSTTDQQSMTSSSAVGQDDSSDRTNTMGTGGTESLPSGGGIGEELRQLVRDKAYEQIGSQKERATGTLGAVAGAVRSATQGLHESGQPALAGYVARAADEIDRWTSRLREQDLDDAVREVQQFARRKPAIFLGVAFGVGVLAARFFKSSGPGSPREQSRLPWTPGSSRNYNDRPSVAHDAADHTLDSSAMREGF